MTKEHAKRHLIEKIFNALGFIYLGLHSEQGCKRDIEDRVHKDVKNKFFE